MDSQLKPAKKKEVRYFGSIEKIKPVESIESILNSLETEKDREFFTQIFEGRKNKSAKSLTLGQNKKKESLININENSYGNFLMIIQKNCSLFNCSFQIGWYSQALTQFYLQIHWINSAKCFFLQSLFISHFFIPLPSSGDCSPVSGPTTWLMFATPVRGLELSEIWGLFI